MFRIPGVATGLHVGIGPSQRCLCGHAVRYGVSNGTVPLQSVTIRRHRILENSFETPDRDRAWQSIGCGIHLGSSSKLISVCSVLNDCLINGYLTHCNTGVALLVCYCWKNSKAVYELRVPHWLIAVSKDSVNKLVHHACSPCFC
eukprot:jgi/Botrbrau1/18765/Bobra.0386s0086.1